MARVTIRIDLSSKSAVGPGKVRLLELVGDTGSISAAGRAMKMSYRRAWLLIAELNRLFKNPVVISQPGGKAGGGARLTPFGKTLVRHYRDMEHRTQRVFAQHLKALEKAARR